jgi:hypothetical protein
MPQPGGRRAKLGVATATQPSPPEQLYSAQGQMSMLKQHFEDAGMAGLRVEKSD